MVKTMERIVNERLKWYLETEDLLAPEQAGFRQIRSTEDQATYLSQEIKDAFQEQKLVLVSWINLQRSTKSGWGATCQTVEEWHWQQHVQLDKILPLQPQGKSLCRTEFTAKKFY